MMAFQLLRSASSKTGFRLRIAASQIRCLSTEFDCSLFKRVDGSKIYPGPQAQLKNKPCLPGSSSPTFPETLSGPREDFPVILQANSLTHELSVEQWTSACREQLDAIMPRYPAVLFRDLPLHSAECFDTFVGSCGYGSLSYVGGSAVRDRVRSKLYNASLEPPEYNIELHNEMSYSPIYNSKIMFYCVTAPLLGAGGMSPICDNRDIFKSIEPAFVAKLRDKGVLYMRKVENSEVPGAASWQATFETTDKKEAEQVMLSRDMEWVWLEGDALRFWYKLDAFTLHPDTGEELWFNQIHSHHATYYRVHPAYPSDLKSADYPMHCTYGDGEEFEEELLQQVRDAGWSHAVGFPWQKGDLIVLDNLIVQHSRLSYTGNRKLLVGLSAARAGQSYHGQKSQARM